MKIAIHHRAGSFSARWIEYCKKNSIEYKLVNAFDSDIINQVKDYDVLMWHHHHAQYKDVLTAKRILFALEHAGVKVFPDFKTAWHFDDKVAQKYLLEAINAPMVTSYVFYDKKDALEWAKNTSYPKVFKLKGGAGATNVKLVKSQEEAFKLIDKAFAKGFSQFDGYNHLRERYQKYKSGKGNLLSVIKGAGRLIVPTKFSQQQSPEKGYIYFQDFIPNNSFDIRVIVIDDKAFAIKRLVRDNDFRASGSGSIIYEKSAIDLRCVKIAFDISDKLKSQCLAYDFIFDADDNPLIVEISYGFSVEAYDKCHGYWNKNLDWNEEKFNPQEFIIENVIKNIDGY